MQTVVILFFLSPILLPQNLIAEKSSFFDPRSNPEALSRIIESLESADWDVEASLTNLANANNNSLINIENFRVELPNLLFRPPVLRTSKSNYPGFFTLSDDQLRRVIKVFQEDEELKYKSHLIERLWLDDRWRRCVNIFRS